MGFIFKFLTAIALVISITGCQTDSKQQILATGKSQVALRNIQSRIFDTADQALTLRTVIATLQDLGFTIDKVNQDIGVVSATKAGDYLMKMTISSRPRGHDQMSVRASAQFNLKAVNKPNLYQKFFDALSQAIFLEANKIR
jgi:hypothetical protein